MSVTPNEYVCARDLVAAAREFIRGEGGCVVNIWWLFDEMIGKFGTVPRVTGHLQGAGSDRDGCGPTHTSITSPLRKRTSSPGTKRGSIRSPVTGLKAMLLGRLQIPLTTEEET